jgi:hypothetical protein
MSDHALAVSKQRAGEALGETLHPLLEGAGYTSEAVEQAVGSKTSPSLPVVKTIAARYRLSAEEPLQTLIRLLYLGEQIEEDAATRVLTTRGLQQLAELDLCERVGGTVRARIRVQPHEDLLVVHDLALGTEPWDDFVGGVAPASLTLAGLTARPTFGSALDIGTGCGVQALLAAAHSARVVGVDVNPRAIEFASAGAALSGIDNVDWRLGDFFAPVEGERFELVVANPPFVLAPERKLLFRDSPQPRDEISRRVVSEIPRFLADGGYGHILCNWVRRPGEDSSAAPRSWLEGAGCDVWLLHYGTEDALTYSASWNRELSGDPSALADELEVWLDAFAAQGIDSVATGVIVLRRRHGTNWFRVDEMPYGPIGSGSDHILRVFAANDDLATLSDDRALLDARFEPVEGFWLEERSVYREGRHELMAAQLRPPQGIGIRGRLRERALGVVRRLDGNTALSELVDDEHADELLAAVKDLYGAGFLVRRAAPQAQV